MKDVSHDLACCREPGARAVFVAIAVDLLIDVENTPGALAQVAAAISDAGVNIAAATCIGPSARAELHVLVPHAEAAKHSLAISGIVVTREREVVVVDVEDRPAVLADLTRRTAGSVSTWTGLRRDTQPWCSGRRTSKRSEPRGRATAIVPPRRRARRATRRPRRRVPAAAAPASSARPRYARGALRFERVEEPRRCPGQAVDHGLPEPERVVFEQHVVLALDGEAVTLQQHPQPSRREVGAVAGEVEVKPASRRRLCLYRRKVRHADDQQATAGRSDATWATRHPGRRCAPGRARARPRRRCPDDPGRACRSSETP